jgi:hypothetical protein
MKFEKKDRVFSFSKNLGYLLMLLVFSIILYFVLSFFDKIPESWGYFHILIISVLIIFIGKGIRYWLER